MIYLGSLRPKRQTTSAKFHGSWLGRTTAVKWLNAYVWCQILLAVTLSVEAQPTFSAIGDQSVYEDQPTELIFLPLSDTNVGLGQILLTAASSNPEVVSATNVTFYAYTDDLGHPGLQRFVSVTPVFGQTGSSTITIVANDGTGSATNSFVLTVNPPPLGAARFANTNVITIPSQGMADPYPSQIVVSNLNGTITNLTVTLSQFNHAYPGDVDMLLVAPDNQTAVVIFSRAGDGGVAFTNSPSPAEEAGVTNITFTLSDTAMFALPYPYPFISIPFKPADYSGTNNQTVGQQEGFGILPANGPLADFPSPAPDPSLYTNTPVALSSFNGFSPNGTWSLYVYDYTNYANPNSGSIGAWSLMIAILSPPTISGLTDQSTPVNTPTAAIPFEIEDVQTPASNLVLTATSSDQTVVSTNDIAFGGSDTNRTITLTPEPNTIGTTTISVIVTDSGGRSTTNNFSMTVNPGQLTVTGITASDKPYDGTTNATVDASAAALTGEGLSGSGVTLDTSAVSGAFVDQNAGTNKTVQIAGLALSGTNAGNYILTQPTTTASITPVVLTVTANNDSRSYDGMGYSGGNGVSYMGFVNGETNNVLGGSLVYSGNSQGAVNVGSYTITPGGLTSGNYAISFENGTLIIGATTLTVSANNAVRGYGQTNPVFTVSYSGFVNGDNSGSLGGTLLVGSVAGTNSAVGSYAIVASGLSSTNYAISYTNGVLSVTNGELTVSASNQSKVYGATLVFAGTEFSVSGLVSTDSVSGASLSSLGAGAGAGTGTYGISITNAAGDAGLTNYQITYVPGSLTVGQAGLGVSANNAVRGYGQTNPVFTVSYSGFVNGDNSGSLGGTLLVGSVAGTNSAVGSYAIVASGLSSTNYAISYTNGVLSVTNGELTVSASNQSKVYGATLVFAGTEFSVSGLVSTDSVSGASLSSLGAGAGAGTGTYGISITNAAGDAGLTNYQITYVPGSLTVGQAGLGVSANNAVRGYGQTNPVFTVSYSGFVNGDNSGSLGGTLLVGSVAGTNSAVGSYAIVASGLSSTNYAISYTNGVLSVTNGELTVSASNQSKVYGATLVFAGTEFSVSGLVSTDSVSGASLSSLGAGAGAGTGTYGISITNAAGDAGLTNYQITYVPGSLTVGQAGLGVSANNAVRGYGQTNPVFTVSYSGFVNGDNSGSLGGTLLVGSVAGTNSAVGSYAIVASGLSSTNYAISYTNGVLSVTNGELTVSASNQSKVYGATLVFAGTEFSVSGLVSTDSVSGASLSSLGAGAGAGTGTYGISITNAAGDAGLTNYQITYVPGSLTVGQAGLGVSANNAVRGYGQTNPVFTVSYSGFVNGDNSGSLGGTLLVGSVAGTNSAVGSYAIVASGLSSTNYAISYTNGVLSVTNGELTVSASNQSKVYGATLVFAGTEFSVSGLVSTDSVSGASLSSLGAGAGAGTGTYGISITNAAGDAGLTNYQITYVPGSLTVGQAGLGVSANNAVRGYGQTNPVFTVSYSGFVNGDNSGSLGGTLLVGSVAGTNSAVGSYAIVASGLSSTNYAISYTNGVLSVTNGELTVSASNQSKVYGATLVFAGTEFSVSGLVSTDSVSGASLSSLGAGAGAGTGTYGISITNAAGDAGLTNYQITYVPGSLTVGQAGLGVSANNAVRGYGQTNPVFTVSYSGFVNGDNSGSLGGTLLVGSVAGTNSAVGSYAIVASGLSSTNYAISYTNGVLSVTNGELTVSASNQSKVYGATLVFAGTEFSVSGLVSTDSVSGASLSSLGAGAGAGTGTYGISITNAAGDAGLTNYQITYVPGSLTVGQAGLGVSANNAVRGYGQTNPVFTVSYSGFVNGDNSGSLGGTLLVGSVAGTNSAVGSYAIVASGLSSTNYAISYTNGVLSVTNGELTVSASNQSKVYGATLVFAGTEFSVSGLVSTDSVSGASLSSLGAGAGAGTGTYGISITNAAGDAGLTNYQITYVPGSLTVGQAGLGVSANNAVRGYGQTNPVFTVSYSGFVNGDNSGSLGGTLLVGSVAGTNSAVGSYAIVASGLSSTNYAISYTNGVLSVTNGELTVSASNQSKVYGATLVFAGTEFSVSGLVSTDSVSGASLSSLGAGAGAGTGTYGISITNAAGDAGLTNYQITYVPGSLTVGQAGLGVSAGGITANNKVYDGTVAATLSTNNVVLVGLVNGDNVSLVTNNYMANFVSASVGTNISVSVSGLTLTGSAATNYTLAQPTGLMANITPKALTIAPTVPSPVITSILLSNGVVTLQWNSVTGVVYRVQYVNSLNGGGWTDLSPDVTAIGPTATQTNAVGSAPQRFYRIKMLNSGLSANNKVYDGTTAATLTLSNVVLVGVINGDSVSLVTNGYTANFATPNVGTSIPVSVVGLTLSGASAGNYTLTQPTGLAADITGKIITIQSAPPPVITSIGLTNGVVTIMWSSVTGGVYRVQYANSLNGGGWTDLSPDVTATGLTASQTNVVGGVSQRFYRVEVLNSGIAANDKVYDGTTVATISSNNVVLMGVVNDDAVGLSTNGYTANFASPNVGTAIPVTVNGLTLTGASAADYTLAPLSGLTANITPTTLTVSAVNNSRTLGLPNPPFTASYSGFVNGEGPSVLNGAPSLTTGATINSPPGPYDITAEIGTLSATNYVFNFVNGTLTVVALPQLSGVALSGNQLAVTWPTIASQSYQLEYTTNLSAAVWTPVGGSMVGTGSPIVVTNGLGVSPQRFFRLSISP